MKFVDSDSDKKLESCGHLKIVWINVNQSKCVWYDRVKWWDFKFMCLVTKLKFSMKMYVEKYINKVNSTLCQCRI